MWLDFVRGPHRDDALRLVEEKALGLGCARLVEVGALLSEFGWVELDDDPEGWDGTTGVWSGPAQWVD